MNKALVCMGMLLLGSPVLAEPPAENKDVMAIVKAVDEATKKVQHVSYDHKVFGLEGLEEQVPRMQGTVKAAKRKTMEESPYRISQDDTATDGPIGSATEVIVSYDGSNFYRIDHDAEKYVWGKAENNAGMIQGNDAQGLMIEFIHPTPFSDELNADSVKLEGTEEIGGVKCDVLYVVYEGAVSEARWFFSQKDHLPRRVERVFPGQGRFVIEAHNLDVKTPIPASAFKLEAPEGYDSEEYKDIAPAMARGIEVGDPAPAFSLENSEGKTVSLDSLKGQIVLLDFWATWCGPCRKAMPSIQALHEEYKDKGVGIYGVNCWDEGNDPVAFMKDNGYTYGLLLEGDEVAEAYHVQGIPTFYIIDQDGKVAYTASGFGPGTDEKIEEVITDLLKRTKQ